MTIQEIKEIFHQKGLKTTPQRIAVYYALSELKHPCAEDVLKHVRETHPTVTTGTIYNVLDSLVKTGLITKVHTRTTTKCISTGTRVSISTFISKIPST